MVNDVPVNTEIYAMSSSILNLNIYQYSCCAWEVKCAYIYVRMDEYACVVNTCVCPMFFKKI